LALTQKRLTIGNNGEAAIIFGEHDLNLKSIEKRTEATIVARGNEVTVSGPAEAVELVVKLFDELVRLIRSGNVVSIGTIDYLLETLRRGMDQELDLAGALSQVIYVTPAGVSIRPRTLGQAAFVKAVESNELVFGIGPAGTGKTYLAVAEAVLALKRKQVTRIILARPAVEAGEKLGFLPGDLQEKVNPYLRPLYDGLNDLLGPDAAQKYMERGVIEVAPLAYMRGRTLNDSFIILDEAQNTSPEQMKMFLTRLGAGAKAVVNGDVTQIDLPKGQSSGLVEVQRILRGVEGIAFRFFSEDDVVRNPLVQRIVRAYSRNT